MCSILWGKIISESSTQYARRLCFVENSRKVIFLVVILMLLSLFSTAGLATEMDTCNKVYFDIPQQRADLSLTQFAEQADLTLIFPYDIVRKEIANRLVGCFSTDVAVRKLLAGTALQPVFNDQGLLASITNGNTEIEDDRMNIKKTTGIAAIFMALFAGPSANAQDSSDVVNEEELVLEEIVVTGVRGSFARALDQKRKATGVVDVIASEDIGEFPDLNISESLQRIPGVTITRSLGEGEQVSVRGLAPQFTAVTINGMQAASAAQGDDGNIAYGRALTFDLFPSELFSGASVYKSPTASLQDGGLSATINMRVPRPFDYDGLTFATTLQMSENNLVEERLPAASLLLSNTFADGRAGVLFQVAYAETILHGELSEGLRFDKTSFDLDGDGTNEFTDVEFARLVRTGVEEYDRTRLGFTGAWQFRPSDNFEIILDAMYGETDRQRERHTLDGNLFGNGPDSPISLTERDGVIVAGTFANELRRTENIYNQVDTEFMMVSLGAIWDISDTLIASGKFGVSDAEFARDEVRITYAVNDPEYSYDLTGDPRYPVTGSSATIDLTDPSQFTLSQVRHHPFFVEDDNFLGQFDIEKLFDDRGITVISGGVQFRSQERAQTEFRQDRSISDPDYLPLDSPFRILSGVGGTTLRGLGFDIFNGDGPIGLLRNFAVPNQRQAFAALIDPSFQPVQNILNSYVVKEEIFAAYIKADYETELAGRPLSGDFGLRYVTTDQTSSSSSKSGSDTIPITHSRDYDNVLPSFNLRWELREDLLLRFAASIGMTRPTLSQINPSQNVQLGSQTVSINNPDLDPFEANQFDIALEWYFANEGLLGLNINNPDLDPFEANQFDIALEWYFANEGLLGLNLFYKDINALVTRISSIEPFFGDNLIFDGVGLSGEDFLVSRFVNGDGAELKGFELSYQQPFTFLPAPFDGFGMMANYTYADSESTVTFGGETFKAPIEGQSKVSYNIVAYYEKGGFSLRTAYHWRDDFLIIRRGSNENRFQEDSAYLDFTASYSFNDHFKVSLDGANLTSEDSYRYDRTTDRNIAFANYGRVISLRLQYKL